LIDSVHPEDIEKLINLVANNNQAFDIEYRIIQPNGSMRWIRDQAFPLKDETGAVYRVVGIAEDITKSKETTVALKQSQNFLRQIIDTNPNLIFVKDLQERFVLANRAFAEIYGTTVEELIGKTEADFNPNLDEVAYCNSINQQVMTTLQPYTIPEKMIITATGETRYFQIIKSPLIAADGKAYQILGVSTDITERKRAEEEIHKAWEREKELGELKSRFISMTSHEFRTPLSAILSSADLIEAYQDGGQQEKRLRHTNRIKSAVSNLTGILNDFLSLSKLEEGKVQCEPVPCHVASFCNEVLEELHALLKPGQHVRAVPIPEELEIVVDKKLLKNVLYNLLSNAIKYSPDGKPIDFLATVSGEGLHIRIRDYGIGIPEEEQQHLFTRFFRAHNVENIQGTGLGLNIVKRYLELMQGNITFESKLGEGTVFSVQIPVHFA
jgi:PAS domain S-box-containing protein